jgi:hypothetical protein
MPKFHKLQRGICLALFAIAGSYSLYNPHAIKTAALALIGVIAYDIVCFFKEKSKPKDFEPEIEEIRKSQEELIQKVSDIRNDASIGKIAETFRRK